MKPRPRTVAIVACFLFAASAIAAVVGTAILFPGPLLDRMWEWNRPGAEVFRKVGTISGVFLWALSVGVFAAARGLLRGRKWAWWFAIALFAVDGMGDLVSFAVTHDALRTVFGVTVSGAFLIALTRGPVRGYFAQQI
jgi:hypothetical protein